MDGRRRREVKETYDLGLGFIGFFTLAFFAWTLYTEIKGEDALVSALTTLVLFLFELTLWILRRRSLNRPEGPDGS
jgi:hypothetical protein